MIGKREKRGRRETGGAIQELSVYGVKNGVGVCHFNQEGLHTMAAGSGEERGGGAGKPKFGDLPQSDRKM